MMKVTVKILLLLLWIMFIASSCEKEISLTPPEELPASASVIFYSNPEGAEIIVNGRKSGYKTPDSLTWLAPGFYEFSLSLQYYRDTSFSLRLNENMNVTVDIDFLANPAMYGSIKFSSIPENADIILNGIKTEMKTPSVMNLLIPGEYEVEFVKKEHRSVATRAIVLSSSTTDAFAELTDTSVWVDYNTATTPFPTNRMTAIQPDFNNNIWIGTDGFGLIKFNGKNYELFNSVNSLLPNNNITSLKLDGDGVLWVGTKGGVVKISDGNISAFTPDNSGLPNNIIEDIEISKNGGVYFATQKGVAYLHNSIWTIYDKGNSPLREDWIKCLTEDENNNLWIGTSSTGLYKMIKTNWTNYDVNNSGLPNNRITALVWDLGKLYVGFDESTDNSGGIVIFDGSNWDSNLFGFRAEKVNDIFIDGGNNKWISTDMGIYYFSSSNVPHIYNRNNSGLKSNNIMSVSEDNNNDIWIATADFGVYKFKM